MHINLFLLLLIQHQERHICTSCQMLAEGLLQTHLDVLRIQENVQNFTQHEYTLFDAFTRHKLGQFRIK